MFTTLIESTPHRKRSGNAGLISALFHSALIAAAVYATASGAASNAIATAATQVTKIHWVKTLAQPASAPARPTPKPKPKSRRITAPKKVPTATPPIDANAQPTPEPDAGATATTALNAGGAPGAFNAFEVDVEVVAVAGTVRPQYPEQLRASATEGQVVAQFVVDEKGRVDRKTFKVISSTHVLFTNAVNRALPQMRFKPARIGGKPVSQLVQQLFVFKLDR
jgi:periplasmic protein TonB